jgi:hypothetical protein
MFITWLEVRGQFKLICIWRDRRLINFLAFTFPFDGGVIRMVIELINAS